MPTSEVGPGAIVRVPFPSANAETRQHRPALVVAKAGGDEEGPVLLWVLMITAAANRRWDGDVAIPDAAAAALPIPSVVRTAKIATVDLARAEPRGRVADETLTGVRAELARRLGL